MRSSGLLFSALDSKSSGPDSRPGWVNVLCKIFITHTVCLSPLRTKKIGTSQFPGKPDKMLGGNLAMEWYPSHLGRSSNTSLNATWKPRTSSSWMGH